MPIPSRLVPRSNFLEPPLAQNLAGILCVNRNIRLRLGRAGLRREEKQARGNARRRAGLRCAGGGILHPDTGEVRFAIGGARRRGGEVGLAVARADGAMAPTTAWNF